MHGDQAAMQVEGLQWIAHECAAAMTSCSSQSEIGPLEIPGRSDAWPLDADVVVFEDEATLVVIVAHDEEGLEVLGCSLAPATREADQTAQSGAHTTTPTLLRRAELDRQVGSHYFCHHAGHHRVLDDQALVDLDLRPLIDDRRYTRSDG
jgi:hypothetical protein